MRVLVLSDNLGSKWRYGEKPLRTSRDVIIDVGNLNDGEHFNSSVFDYDVSIIHIEKSHYHTLGYYANLPKLQKDTGLSLEHGNCIICLPNSTNFISERSNRDGMRAYDWLIPLGVNLQDNEGSNIKASGAGMAQAIQEYLKYAPKYYQIVTEPIITSKNRLAVVNDTNILVGLEYQVGKGTLVILPPPVWQDNNYNRMFSKLLGVARHYYNRAQRHIFIGDVPDWLPNYLLPKVKSLDEQIHNLINEKNRYDSIAYVLYGTGPDLETSVALLFKELGLKVEQQPRGANIDFKARHTKLDLGFSFEITGTKDIIRKGSKKVAQAWQYLDERSGTYEENDRLIIIANSQCHLDPNQRNREGYTKDIVKMLERNGVLMMTTMQLYELWKAVHDGIASSDDIVRDLHSKSGLLV